VRAKRFPDKQRWIRGRGLSLSQESSKRVDPTCGSGETEFSVLPFVFS
jgi:hypothetical protein